MTLTMQMRASIMVSMNRLNTTNRVQVVRCLLEGCSIRSTVRMTGVAKNTVTKLAVDLGAACAAFHDEKVRGIAAKRVQCDEIWAFVGSKQKNTSPEKAAIGWGDAWTWTAIDAESKLIISYALGDRSANTAKYFMHDLAERVATRIQLTTDGYRVYANAVEGAFGADVDYAMLVKLYGAPGGVDSESRYSPAKCIGCRTGILAGDPDPAHISTSYVERQNLNMRMGMRRFTRLTNAFSKKIENHYAALSMYFVFYNFCRVHQSLRVTPAMEAGLTDHVWEIEEMLGLVEKYSN